MNHQTEKQSNWLFYIAVSCLLLAISWITYAFLSNWSLGYNSDQALLGLMAKSVVETGERPLFVWSVGYQGIFMEVYLSALVFHFFDSNPFYLNFAPTFYFLVFLGLFFSVLRSYFDRMVAIISCLFLVLSTPTLYLLCMRALPNFSESFLLGMVAFILYGAIVKRVYQDNLFDMKSAMMLTGFGVVVGFSLYTFVLSWYFFLATCLCSAYLFFNNLSQWREGSWLSSYLRPHICLESSILRKVTAVPVYFFLALGIFGLIGFLLNLDFTQYRLEGKRGVLPIHFLFGSVFFHSIISFSIHFFKFQNNIKSRMIGAGLFIMGLLIGFSPKLYYWAIGGRTRKGATVSGRIDQILERLSIGGKANTDFLNVPPQFSGFNAFDYFVLAVSLGSLSYFIWYFIAKIRASSNRLQATTVIQRGLPFLFLPLVIFGAFSLSSSVVDAGSGRYLLAMIIFYSVAFGFTSVSLWRRYPQVAVRVFVAAMVLMTMYRGGDKIYNSVRHESTTKDELAHMVQVMDDNGIKYAYGDYWAAYVLNLFTNERIIIEPIYSNYSPHYAERINKQSRIGYIDHKDPKYKLKDGKLEINDKVYKLEKKMSMNQQWDLYILNRDGVTVSKF